MKFFLLNIKSNSNPWGKDKTPARRWLDEFEEAPIFFGDWTIAEIMNGRCNPKSPRKDEPRNFLDVLGRAERENFDPIFVTIDGGDIWLYRPVAGPTEGRPVPSGDGSGKDIPKFFKIEHICRLDVSKVPLILASMRVNRWLSSGTFVELDAKKHRGNIQAIRFVLKKFGGMKELAPSPVSRIDCLSSVEFETLVAKLFEENGFFVPAYRGGFMDGADLVAKPIGRGGGRDGAFGKLGAVAEREGVISLQVKLRFGSGGKDVERWLNGYAGRFLITADDHAQTNLAKHDGSCFGRQWLVSALRESPASRDWLERSTEWIPNPAD